MIIVRCPYLPQRGGSKTQIGHFSSNIALLLKKVCYKVSLCENCQRQSCGAFTGLTIHAKIIGGGRPLLPEILGQIDRAGVKSPIFDLFSRVAPNTFLSVKTVSDCCKAFIGLTIRAKMIGGGRFLKRKFCIK